MPDIKLKNGSGVEQTYTGVDTITVPLADGTGNWTFGLTDEELVIEGDLTYTFDRIPAITTKYGSRMTIKPIKYRSDLEDQSMLTLTLDAPCSFNQAFNAGKTAKLPKIIGSDKALQWCSEISSSQFLREDEALEFISSFDRIVSKIETSSNYQMVPIPFKGASFRNLDSIQLKWHQLINNEAQNEYYNSGLSYGLGNSPSFYNLDELNNIAIIANQSLVRPLTNNIFSNLYGMYRVKNVTFATDNGTPYKVNWKTQTIDFSNKSNYSVGWYYSGSYNTNFAYNSGINADMKNICNADNSDATLEGSQARYQALKNDPDNLSASSKTITYNGTSGVYIASLFSRYNHDSAVNTINSLPDTSEYLATAGGTNTIKFLGIAGAETDGGAINTLIDEEIAVAAAKGWTVTLV